MRSQDPMLNHMYAQSMAADTLETGPLDDAFDEARNEEVPLRLDLERVISI